MSRDINCLEYSIEEYDSTGGFASTTICIETCASDAGSSRRSSKKSTSTRRHRRRKKSQLWLSSAEDDLSVATVLRAATGKARCAVKTPFSAGGAGRPYNKKLRKKTFQHQGHGQQCPLQRSEFGTNTAAAMSPIEVSFQETSRMITQAAASSFFISETHRAVAEATTPWIQSHGSGSTRYQFLGHGGLTANNAHRRKKRTGRSGHNNNNDNDDDDDADWPEFLDIAAMGGGSRRMEPMQSPSMLPPAHLLPASKADLSSDLLERCFLETRLSDDDHFSLL